MALVYVNSAARNNGTTSDAILDYPSGMAAGDIAIAHVIFGGGTNVVLSNIPSGWIAVPNTRVDSTTVVGTACYYKLLTGLESGQVQWTLNGAQTNGGQMYVVRGGEPGAIINASNSQANASSTNVVAPSITTTVDGCMLIYFGSISAAATFTPDGAMTERLDVNSAETADQLLTTAGSTGTRTGVASSAGVNTGTLIAIAPRYPRLLLGVT